MFKTIVYIWATLIFVNLFLLFVKIFEYEPKRVIFSIYMKSFIINGYSFLVFGIVYKYFEGNLVWEDGALTRIFPVFLCWCVYFIFMMRYGYDAQAFTWFNGLYLRRAKKEEIEHIILREKENRVAKVIFVGETRKKGMRTDIDVEGLVQDFARANGIPVSRKKG